MTPGNQAKLYNETNFYQDGNEQLDHEIHRFQQTEFEEHKAECFSRCGVDTRMPSPSATSLWHHGLRKWGKKWLEREHKLRQATQSGGHC